MGNFADDFLNDRASRKVLGGSFRYASEEDVENEVNMAQEQALVEQIPLRTAMTSKRQPYGTVKPAVKFFD